MYVQDRNSAGTQWRKNVGARGDICNRPQHFGSTKLRSKYYIITTKCQLSTDANNYDLQNVECHRLIPGCGISSRSPKFAKGVVTNLSYVFRWSFCLQQSAPACGLTHGCVTMRSDSQGCELSDFAIMF